MDILEKLFGSAAKLRIMRLFIFNRNLSFDLDKVVTRTKISVQAARLNLRTLEEIGLIKPRTFVKEVKKELPKGKKTKNGSKGSRFVKKKVRGWTLNDNFVYLEPLQGFLIFASPLQDQMIIRKFNRTGKIRLLVVSGVFIQEKESRVDILVVGDSMRRSAVDAAVKDIEAELGKDITYSVFETRDFNYRVSMYDKLIRDILDYPHKKLVNRLGV